MRQPPLRSTMVLALALIAASGPAHAAATGPTAAPRALPDADEGIVVLGAPATTATTATNIAIEPVAPYGGSRALRAALTPSDGVRANDGKPAATPDQNVGTPRCAWPTLAPGAPVLGSLTADDCRWGQLVGPDQFFQVDPARVDIYTLDLTERSTVALTLTPGFDAIASLRDAGFGLLRDVQAPAGGPTVLNATLPAGRFELAIRPKLPGGSIGGDYTVQAATTPAPQGAPCAEGTLGAEDVVSGALAAGCAIFDWLPDQAFGNAAQLYRLVLDEPGDLSLTLTSSNATFAPLLALMTDDRTRDLAVDASGAGDPTPDAAAISIALPAGQYWVMAASAQPGGVGDFTLASQFDSAAGKCSVLPAADAALAFGAPVTATLAADGCRTGYLSTALAQNAPAQVFRVSVPQYGDIGFGLQASGFEPLVQLLSSKFDTIAGVGTIALGNGSQLQISTPRDFLVVVQGSGGAEGDVQLTVGLEEGGKPCQIQPIGATGSASGSLDGNDCNLEDWIGLNDASKIDLYPVYLPSRGRVQVTAASSDLTAYLWFLGRDRIFNVQAVDDGTGKATLDQVFEAGHYLIGVNSLSPAIGDYALTTTFTPQARPAPCPTSPLTAPSVIDAELSGSECRLFDVDPTSSWPSPIDRYRLTLPSYGELSVIASSDEFVLRAALFDVATMTPIAIVSGDDIPAEATAIARLPAGEYFLDIDDAFLNFPQSGAYHLELSFLPLPDPRPCTEVDLAGLPGDLFDPGYTVDGELTDTDCVVGDFPKTTYSQFPVDGYTVTVPQRGTITIELRSDDLDPRLDVLDWAYNLVLQNSDIDDIFDTNARVESAVGPGRYRVQAVAEDFGAGPYQLEVIFRAEPYIPPAEVTPTPSATGGPTSATPPPTPATPATPGPTVGRLYLPWAGQRATITE